MAYFYRNLIMKRYMHLMMGVLGHLVILPKNLSRPTPHGFPLRVHRIFFLLDIYWVQTGSCEFTLPKGNCASQSNFTVQRNCCDYKFHEDEISYMGYTLCFMGKKKIHMDDKNCTAIEGCDLRHWGKRNLLHCLLWIWNLTWLLSITGLLIALRVTIKSLIQGAP